MGREDASEKDSETRIHKKRKWVMKTEMGSELKKKHFKSFTSSCEKMFQTSNLFQKQIACTWLAVGEQAAKVCEEDGTVMLAAATIPRYLACKKQ